MQEKIAPLPLFLCAYTPFIVTIYGNAGLKAGADFLVTGDKHLLKLRNYANFEIIKLANFLKILQQTPTE